ncbi:MAG: L,D-transpeptidase family protein [Acetobacteraceae bacterium]|nr:L,D-transpeptidase family protein [Acetobacteraceae bacterium]
MFRRDLLARAAALPLVALGAGLPGAGRATASGAFAAGSGAVERLRRKLEALAAEGLITPRPAAAEAMTAAFGAPSAGLWRAAAEALAELLHGALPSPPQRPDVRRDVAAVPLEPWLARLSAAAEPAEVLEAAIALDPWAAPLRAEMGRLRARQAAGGWPGFPRGANLEPGQRDPRVPALRARLAAEDPAVASLPDSGTLYDRPLVEAVRRWQAANFLEPDGRIGRMTQKALDEPVEQRIAQCIATLDMRRAAARPGPERLVEVNLPAFWLTVTEGGRRLLEMAVIVGRPDRPTPLLDVRMTAIQFNPPWGVPERNARQDLLPRFRRDPVAMRERGFRLFRVVNGERVEVDPTEVDWSRITDRNFPFVVRQDAGDANALGRIKFVMPNSEAIFMHDTPDRHLFRTVDRAYSSGCIRLSRPMEFLDLLIEGLAGWDRARAERSIASGVTSTIGIRTPPRVLLSYRTTEVAEGRVRMRPDFYDLDLAYVQAMRQHADIAARPAEAG